jgi:hypothetical protein
VPETASNIVRLTRRSVLLSTMRLPTALLLVFVVLVVATGCIGDGETENARDAFLENNVSGYEYESTTAYEFGAQGRTTFSATQTRSVIDRQRRELRANLTTMPEEQKTQTYLVNGTLYTKTTANGTDTGWLRFEDSNETVREWEARDELAVYEELLEGSSVDQNGTEEVRGTEANRLEVSLNKEDRTDLLLSKFGDDRSLFESAEINEFDTTAWITDNGTLLRSRTNASMTIPDQQTQMGVVDMNVEVYFADDFYYDDSYSVEVPEEASDAPRAD